MDTGSIITGIIRVIGRIVVAVLLAIALVKMIEQVLEGVLPKKGTHKVVRVIDLFQSACDHLNLTLQSQLLNSKIDYVVMPIRREEGTDNSVAYPTSQDQLGTFGDVIRAYKDVWNADYTIIDNVFIFEKEDYFESEGTFVMPSIFTDQDNLRDNFRLNSSEFSANFIINFQYDTVDENTLDDTEKLSFGVTYEPTMVGNEDLRLMKGLHEVNLPFALGKKKKSLSDIEEIALRFARSGDKLMKIFGKTSNFASKIEEKIDSLLLTSEFTGRPKLLRIEGSKISSDIYAEDLWENWKSRSFVGEDPNQWYIFDDLRIPLTLNGFKLLLENRFGVSETGEKIRMDVVKWKPAINMAEVSFRLKKKYTNNLKIANG